MKGKECLLRDADDCNGADQLIMKPKMGKGLIRISGKQLRKELQGLRFKYGRRKAKVTKSTLISALEGFSLACGTTLFINHRFQPITHHAAFSLINY